MAAAPDSESTPGWIDVHAHLADSRFDAQTQDRLIAEAIGAGMRLSLQGGVSPTDWERQRELAVRYPGRIGVCIGLHPVWVSHASEGELYAGLVGFEQAVHEAAEGSLRDAAPDAPVAWGELGLDGSSRARADSLREQREIFEAQLEVLVQASWRREPGEGWRPLVFHVVRAEGTFLEIARRYAPRFKAKLPPGVPSWGLIHSISLSSEGARECLALGLEASFSGSVTREAHKRVRETALALAAQAVLLETDTPDQPPCGWSEGEPNGPRSIVLTADALARLRGRGETGEGLLRLSEERFRAAFGCHR